MAYIKHAILAQKALPVAPHIINRWVINRSVNEVDFAPELEEPSSSAVLNTLPQASVLAIITVEPASGRVLGSHWKVSGDFRNTIKFDASRLYANVEDQSLKFNIVLPPLMNFEFNAEGPHKNFSKWMDWDQLFQHGSVILKNKKGSVCASDKEAILAICPQAASGMMVRIVIVPKSLGNFIFLVNVIPGTLDNLHTRCRDQGLDLTVVHHPCLKPCLKNKNNSIVIPYARIEKPSDNLCMGHLPVVEIIAEDSDRRLLPVSAALREELFALHRQATYIASTSGVIEDALNGDWPSNPSMALPTGAGKWPQCPQEIDSNSGETLCFNNSLD